jgi:hypothetical protein
MGAAASFPPLTWVVEDFFQDLGDTTPTEWLMSFIDEGTSSSSSSSSSAVSSAATPGGAGDSSSSSGADSGGGVSRSDRPTKRKHGAHVGPGRRPLVDGNYTISRLFGGGTGGAEAKGMWGAAKGAAGGSRIKAHTLFLPASSRMALRSLNTVPYGELDAEFLDQVSTLRRDLLASTSAKGGGGAGASKVGKGGGGASRGGASAAASASAPAPALTGRGLAALLRVLVASVSAGHFPSLPSLWSSWEGQLLQQARAAALERHAAAAEEALLGGGATTDDANANTNAASNSDASVVASSTPTSTPTASSSATPRRPPLPPDEFAARLTAARSEAEELFRDSLFGLEQLWRGPLADLRRELAAREAKDTELNAAAVVGLYKLNPVDPQLDRRLVSTLEPIK